MGFKQFGTGIKDAAEGFANSARDYNSLAKTIVMNQKNTLTDILNNSKLYFTKITQSGQVKMTSFGKRKLSQIIRQIKPSSQSSFIREVAKGVSKIIGTTGAQITAAITAAVSPKVVEQTKRAEVASRAIAASESLGRAAISAGLQWNSGLGGTPTSSTQSSETGNSSNDKTTGNSTGGGSWLDRGL